MAQTVFEKTLRQALRQAETEKARVEQVLKRALDEAKTEGERLEKTIKELRNTLSGYGVSVGRAAEVKTRVFRKKRKVSRKVGKKAGKKVAKKPGRKAGKKRRGWTEAQKAAQRKKMKAWWASRKTSQG